MGGTSLLDSSTKLAASSCSYASKLAGGDSGNTFTFPSYPPKSHVHPVTTAQGNTSIGLPGYFGVPPPQYAPSLKPVQQLARGITSGGQGVSTRLNSAQQASGRSAPFMGLPASAEVIGPKLAVWRGPASAGCQVCRACGPSAGHCGWECPVRYASVFGAPCPGFTAAGDRVASDWSGPDLTAKACAAWKVFSASHSLVCARPVPGPPAF